MKLDVIYAGGALRRLDTDSFTKAEPFDGSNMLTEFRLDLQNAEEDGIWLEAHCYDANPAYREQGAQASTPVAHVKRGWRFLVAEAAEMAQVESVLLDGDAVIHRVCGELVNVLLLDRSARTWLRDADSMAIADKIAAVFAVETERSGHGCAEAEVGRTCGCSLALALEMQGADESPTEAEEAEEEDWMEEME